MVIVKLQGGLGNQMFQYAAARRLAIKSNQELKLDLRHFDQKVLPNGLPYRSFDLDIFELEYIVATSSEIDLFLGQSIRAFGRLKRKIQRTFSPKKYLLEPHFNFYSQLLEERGDVYLEGYWQCEKYFEDIEDLLRKDFRIKTTHSETGLALKREIGKTNSVCLNIRRQEFASNKYPNHFVGKDYILAAVEKLNELIGDFHVYIFSDELSWVKENLTLACEHTIVEEEFYGNKFRDCLDLMRSCKHFIIPNSSFGWWAAWLGTDSDKIVIAPEKWLNDPTLNTEDVLPNKWLKI